MSGGGGGIIIIDQTKATLTTPIVHGALPGYLQKTIDPILAKESADWTEDDKDLVGKAYAWALCNL